MIEKREYSIYKGDEYLFTADQEECAKRLNVKPWTIYYYSTKAHIERLQTRKTNKPVIIAVALDDDEDDE